MRHKCGLCGDILRNGYAIDAWVLPFAHITFDSARDASSASARFPYRAHLDGPAITAASAAPARLQVLPRRRMQPISFGW